MTKRRESGLRRSVVERAQWRCEYCHAPQAATGQTFHIDHIVPERHGGELELNNLALACPHCNLARGARRSIFDQRTGRTVALFNPRRDVWQKHFRWSPNRLRLIGRTDTGRATILVLDLNGPDQIEARTWWYLLGLIP